MKADWDADFGASQSFVPGVSECDEGGTAMLYQQKQVAAQALRVGVSCSRWAMIISTISGGKLRGSVGFLECLCERGPMSFALERYQTMLAKRSAPGICE